MNDETIIQTDPDTPETEKPRRFAVITGGQGGSGNWLGDMEPGTVFLARPKRREITQPGQAPAPIYMATEFQVIYKTQDDGGAWIRLATNLESNPMYLWVNAVEFCIYNELKKVIATPEDIIEMDKKDDSADNPSE